MQISSSLLEKISLFQILNPLLSAIRDTTTLPELRTQMSLRMKQAPLPSLYVVLFPQEVVTTSSKLNGAEHLQQTKDSTVAWISSLVVDQLDQQQQQRQPATPAPLRPLRPPAAPLRPPLRPPLQDHRPRRQVLDLVLQNTLNVVDLHTPGRLVVLLPLVLFQILSILNVSNLGKNLSLLKNLLEIFSNS